MSCHKLLPSLLIVFRLNHLPKQCYYFVNVGKWLDVDFGTELGDYRGPVGLSTCCHKHGRERRIDRPKHSHGVEAI